MTFLLLLALLGVLIGGPSAVWVYYQITKNETITHKARLCLLLLPPAIPICLVLLFTTVLATTTYHLPQDIVGTNAQIRGSQLAVGWGTALLYSLVYATTMVALFKCFGDQEIPDDPEYDDEG